jgi:hypothetical protein
LRADQIPQPMADLADDGNMLFRLLALQNGCKDMHCTQRGNACPRSFLTPRHPRLVGPEEKGSNSVPLGIVGVDLRPPSSLTSSFRGTELLSKPAPSSAGRHGPMLLPLVEAWLFLMTVNES